MNILKAIKDSIPIVDYLRQKGYSVRQIGSNLELKECPFCGGHDCFRIYESGQRWSCFQCPDKRISKDIIDLESYFNNVPLKTAVKNLADFIGVRHDAEDLSIVAQEVKEKALEYFEWVLHDSIGKEKQFPIIFKGESYNGTIFDYLRELRQHTVDSLKKFRVGMSDGLLIDYLKSSFKIREIRASGLSKNDKDLFSEGLIIYPHFVNGRVVHFTAKDPTGKKKPHQTEARFRDEDWWAYNQDCLLDVSKPDETGLALLLVEGENDLISSVEKGGYSICVAMIGNISDAQQKKLIELTKDGWTLIMGFDGDTQGVAYRNLLLNSVGGRIFDIPYELLKDSDIDAILSLAKNPSDKMQELLDNLDYDPKIKKIVEDVSHKKKDAIKDEIIPRSLPHERFILRKLIESEDLNLIFDLMASEIFFKQEHLEMFESIQRLYLDNKTINELVCFTMFKELNIIKDEQDFDDILNEHLQSDIESAVEILIKKHRRRKYISFANELISLAKDDKKTIEEIDIKTDTDFLKLSIGSSKKSVEVSSANICATSEALRHSDSFIPVDTPFEDINSRLIFGFSAPHIAIIAGRPGMGKSILKKNLQKYWCEKGFGVLDFSPENRVKMEIDRLLSLTTGIPFKRVALRLINDEVDVECSVVLKNIEEQNWAFWQFEELANLNVAYIARKVKQAQRDRKDIKSWIVAVDTASKISDFRGRDDYKAIEVGLGKMRELCVDLNFCFVPIVHIGRGREAEKKLIHKKPTLAELRGSGGWENEADIVWLLFREAYYDSSVALDLMEINIAKQRSGGTFTAIKLFLGENCKLEDYEEGSSETLPPME